MGSFCSVISSVPVLSSSCWREFYFLKRPLYFIQRIKPVFVLKIFTPRLRCADEKMSQVQRSYNKKNIQW